MSDPTSDSAFEIHEVYDDPSDVVDENVERHSRLLGKLLLACFLCPMMLYSILQGGSKIVFFWDFLSTREGAVIVWTLIPLVAGLSALFASRIVSGKALCTLLAATGLGGLTTLAFLDVSDTSMLMGSSLTIDGGWLFLLFLAAVMTIAIGNRLRKQVPDVKLPHVLMGAAGLVFTAFFFVPVIDGKMAVSFLFSGRAWDVDAFGNVLLLIVLAYGVTAALAPLRLSFLDWTRTGVVVVHRLVLFGLPLGILLSRSADASGYEAAFTGGSTLNHVLWALKVFGLFYCLIALSVVGALGWLRFDIQSRIEAQESA